MHLVVNGFLDCLRWIYDGFENFDDGFTADYPSLGTTLVLLLSLLFCQWRKYPTGALPLSGSPEPGTAAIGIPASHKCGNSKPKTQ